MEEKLNRSEPKKIRMPPLVDETNWYDMLWLDNDKISSVTNNENYSQNNSESIQQLESDKAN
jgi:hypothetical protein